MCRTIKFRISELDYIELQKKYQLSGRKNRSKFYRELILSKTILRGQPESHQIFEQPLLKQIIIEWRSDLKKIGVNYNQVVKLMHTHFTDKKFYAGLKKLHELTNQLIENNEKLMSKMENFNKI